MKKTYVKIILGLVLCVLALILTLLAVRAVSTLATYFQTGADPASALNIVPNKPPDLQVALTWQPDDPDTGRKMEPFTRILIESAYMRAWLQWNISYLRGEPYGLETYFTGPALESVKEAIAYTHEQGWSLAQTDLTHELTLHFYHADGSVAAFTAENVHVIRFIRDHTGQLVTVDETLATYDVVMMLEDGNWRVRHWLRVEGERIENRPTLRGDPLGNAAKGSAGNNGFVTAAGDQLMLDGEPYYIRGVNYYPQATPWHDFWPEYSSEQTQEDLALVRALGLNSVRIFVPFAQFGEHELDPDLVANLDDFLAQAEQLEIKVIVTLFDFRTDYQLLLWPNADRHLEALLDHYRDNRTILAWDIKNEPDLDYGGGQRIFVDQWLIHIVNKGRQLDPNHLFTIGWSSPQAATELVDIVDFVSFHYYAPTELWPQEYAALEAAAQGKPIVMSEFGLPTWNSFLFPNGHSLSEQERYYGALLQNVGAAELAGYQAWTLYDFDHVPGDVAGMMPWQKGPQANMGLVRESGEFKPAARLLAADAALEVSPAYPWARFLKPFWFTVVVTLLVIFAGAGRVWGWLRTRKSTIELSHPAPETLVPVIRRARAAGVATSYRDILAGMGGLDPEELLSPAERKAYLKEKNQVGQSRSFKALLGHLAGVDNLDDLRAKADRLDPPPADAPEVKRGVAQTYRRLIEELSAVTLEDDETEPDESGPVASGDAKASPDTITPEADPTSSFPPTDEAA